MSSVVKIVLRLIVASGGGCLLQGDGNGHKRVAILQSAHHVLPGLIPAILFLLLAHNRSSFLLYRFLLGATSYNVTETEALNTDCCNSCSSCKRFLNPQ